MKLVIIESPYAGDVVANIKYAQQCMRDSFCRGEAPFASHLLYTQDNILDDKSEMERVMGIEAGFAWGKGPVLVAVYTDRGISTGMIEGMNRATQYGHKIEFRRLTK